MSLNPDALTWTALLGQWMDFAASNTVAPNTPESRAWADSVTDVITLQALTFALRELSRVPAEDRGVARERAAWLIERHAGHLDEVWRGIEMPLAMLDMLTDVRRALDRSVYAGSIELIHASDQPGVMPELDPPDDATWLAVMQPGTLIMPGEPIAWWIGPTPLSTRDVRAEPIAVPRQVYRQTDEAGMIARDVIQPIDAASPPGLPLLVPLRADGETIGRFTLDPETWEARQRAALSTPVIDIDVRDDDG